MVKEVVRGARVQCSIAFRSTGSTAILLGIAKKWPSSHTSDIAVSP